MSVKKYLFGRYATKTDIGRIRVSNEDRCTALTNTRGNILLVVCDGMGGQNKGELASSMAVDSITRAFQEKPRFLNKLSARTWVANTIRTANSEIFREASRNPDYQGMGTTIKTRVIVVPIP